MKLSVSNLNLKNKRVLLRVDFNVPLKEDGTISDATRIIAALPTIEYIVKEGGSVILLSHLGRPEGKRNMKYSLAPCARYLEQLLQRPVPLAPDCIGPAVEKMAQDLKSGQLLMLENLRFHEAEEHPDKDPSFTKQLAALGDLYVNDAFGTAHRAHASTALLASYFPGKAAAGFLLQKEIEFLGSHFAAPQRPFYALIGGAKVSTKIKVLSSLLPKVDALFIGGGMAYTFLKAQGISIGDSIHEDAFLETARTFLEEAKGRNTPVYLPEDVVIANAFNENAATKVIACKQGIPSGWQGMDLGPQTVQKWTDLFKGAAMIFWNGPFGVFELAPFAHGTNAIAKSLSSLKATTIVGGGDSVAAINQLGLADKFTHVSTGGGASLEYIEEGHLPGVDALSDGK
jgi:phosphoglycerate kinase